MTCITLHPLFKIVESLMKSIEHELEHEQKIQKIDIVIKIMNTIVNI